MAQILKVTINCAMYSVVCQNVLHFLDTNPTDNQREALAFELLSDWIEHVRAGQPRDINWLDMDIGPDSPPGQAPTNFPIGVLGANSGSDGLCTSLAWVWLKKTLLTGPANRGRYFIPGFLNGFLTNGLINQAGIDWWQPHLNHLNGRYTIGGDGRFRLVVRHAEGWTEVNQLVLSKRVGHMRSRKPGIGV